MLGRAIFLAIIIAALLGLAAWLHLPLAPSLDAVIGIITLLWLFFIVTVPWNMYFQAQKILYDAQVSSNRGIKVDADALAYAKRWAKIALWIALGLHLATTAALCALAFSGAGLIGWLGATASIVLTFLRPGLRAYAHIRDRLQRINAEIEIPREDSVELRSRLKIVERQLEELSLQLRQFSDATDSHLRQLDERVTNGSDRQLEYAEHVRLELLRVERDAKNTVAEILGDAAIVGHVRELVRFFKQA